MHTPSAPQPAVEIVCQSEPGRLNEDAWLVMQAGPLGEKIALAVIDGATTRLTPPPLQRHLDAQPVRLTPAAYAARLTRDSLARQVASGAAADLRALLLEANTGLYRVLTGVFGALELERMGFPDEVLAPLAHDPRLVRLGLPACVVTLAEYDPADHMLRYAHVGDTLLMVVYEDGRVIVPTVADVTPARGDLKRAVLTLRAHFPDLPFRDLVRRPEITRMDTQSGLYHNYVDEHGLPQPSRGVGVINGLPELRYFVKTGQVSLDGVAMVCLMTDGLEWPASASEAFTDDPDEAVSLMQMRYADMAAQVAEFGLPGYLARVWDALADDPDHELYPRIKLHDDATGVLLRFAE